MEENKSKLRIHLTAILTYGAIFLLCGCAAHTGSRSGQVFDAITNKPIEGAVVKYSWRLTGFLEGAIGGGSKTVSPETLTDKKGKYYILDQRVERDNTLELGLKSDEVIIYKDGYAAYIADLSSIYTPVTKPIGYPDDNQTYSKKNNIVKLYPWKEGESHYGQVDFIDAITRCSGQGELLKKELEPERKRAREERLLKRKQK